MCQNSSGMVDVAPILKLVGLSCSRIGEQRTTKSSQHRIPNMCKIIL